MQIGFVVKPGGASVGHLLRKDEADLFEQTKLPTLGYRYASVHIPVGNSVRLKDAPLGWVKTPDDAMKLIEAVRGALPGISMEYDAHEVEDATDIVWHDERT